MPIVDISCPNNSILSKKKLHFFVFKEKFILSIIPNASRKLKTILILNFRN